MKTFLGIDLGTSSLKTVLINEKLELLDQASRNTDAILSLEGLGSEQSPESWWQCLLECLSRMDCSQVAAVGFSGQMHGLVMVDREIRPVGNAIIWADQRSAEQIRHIYETVPEEEFAKVFENRLSTGFLLPSLVWVREKEPARYEKIYKVMLPKDYIRYRICGELGTDASDACSTGMWDMKARTWAFDILKKLDIPAEYLVESHESYEKAGTVTKECAERTGLKEGTFVAFGGGDSLMMELGNGMIRGGLMASTIGTACHLTCALDAPTYDPKLRTNTWCHGGEHLWSIMGAHLSGGVALKWLKNNILGAQSFDAMTALASEVPAGSEGLLFLPYLNGERTPHNDPNAKAVYLGMTLRHDKRHMIRSTMEGIVYSMKESYAIFRSLGIRGDRIIAAGGGAKSPLFRQIQADMYDCPIYINQGKEQASIGAAMTAAVGSGYYKDYEEACARMVHLSPEATEPIPENVKKYEEEFQRFKEIYFANKALF